MMGHTTKTREKWGVGPQVMAVEIHEINGGIYLIYSQPGIWGAQPIFRQTTLPLLGLSCGSRHSRHVLRGDSRHVFTAAAPLAREVDHGKLC